MDIAYYVSELLGELGEVNVPGLGNFTQRKIDGYYNDEEAKFYPPSHVVHFNPNFAEDDILAEYIAEQKKISLASSKYFTEKYVNSVKQEAILKDVPLADLGSIRFIVHEFHFKSAGTLVNDPAFFGYPQITLKKLSVNPVVIEAQVSEPAHEAELLPAPIHQESIQEPEITSTDEVTHDPASIEPPVTEIPQELLEIETEFPLPIAEEVAPPVVSEEPVIDAEALIETEPVKETEPAEFDLEAYLRELEASAGIVSTEPNFQEQEIETAPVAVTPEPEIVVQEPEITAHEPVAAIEESAPEIIAPEIEPYSPPLPTVELSREPYTPDPELQQYILDSATGPKSEVFLPKQEAVSVVSNEEDFIFSGKGYDDVDNRQSGKRNLWWLWITLIIILLIGAAAGYLWYTHRQKVLKAIKANSVPLPLKVPLNPDTIKNKADSSGDTTQPTVIKDTTEKEVIAPVTSAIDSTKTRYELIGTRARTIAEANLRVTNYKSLGISDAHIVLPGPGEGKLIKVSLGTFMNRADAINKKREILSTGNVSEIEIKKINPKK
jgi:hypothetical protein